MSVRALLIESIAALRTSGKQPVALDVNPADLYDLESEIVQQMESCPAPTLGAEVRYQPSGPPRELGPGYRMTFLGVPLYASPATPRGEFRAR